jgi:hypothetical protein
MRYLSRNKVYEKLETNHDAKKIYIICEGSETEEKYFKYFQGFSSNIDIIPIPSENGKTDPLKLKENAELLFLAKEDFKPKYELSIEYKDEVWFVIDTDNWNEGNKIEQLRVFCEQNNNDLKQWFLVQSNPCFELWQFYHFSEVKPIDNEVQKCTSFKEFVNTKIKGGFDNRSMPIELERAIENSMKNFEVENNQPKLYSTELHNLGLIILPFIKVQLDKSKEMTIEN